MTASAKPGEVQKPAEEVKKPDAPAPAITDASVVAKVQKGEKLSAEETEVFKALPKDQLPSAPLSDTPKTAPAATDAPKSDDKKSPDTAGDAPKEVTEDRKKIILAELDKPDELVDLSKFKSDVEVGLYWDLKKARRKNQKLSDELEITRVQKIVTDLKTKETKTAEEKTDTDIILAALKDRDPEDIVTVKDIQIILENARKKKPEEEKKPEAPAPILTTDQIRIQKIEAEQKLDRAGIKDFEEVTSYAEAALKDDPESLEILRDTARKGGNTAEKTYWLIKGSKLWPAINKKMLEERAKTGKPAAAPAPENVERGERFEKNEEKIRTTGPGTGAAAPGEYTVGEIASMTHGDVRKLSKKQRQAILENFGSTPNYST